MLKIDDNNFNQSPGRQRLYGMTISKQASTLGKRVKQEGCHCVCSKAAAGGEGEGEEDTGNDVIQSEEDQDTWVGAWAYKCLEWARGCIR